MNFMVESVNINEAEGTIEEFVSFVYDFLRPRSRKTNQLAEMIAHNNHKYNQDGFDTNKYFANKNGKRVF